MIKTYNKLFDCITCNAACCKIFSVIILEKHVLRIEDNLCMDRDEFCKKINNFEYEMLYRENKICIF